MNFGLLLPAGLAGYGCGLLPPEEVELPEVPEPDGEDGLPEVAGLGRTGTWTPGSICEGLPSLSV